MIDGAREFAITWLLEPTAKGYTYEYRFKFITFHTETVSIMRREEDDRSTPENPYHRNIYDYELWTPPNGFAIPQATVFRVNTRTGSREKVGIIEYFDVNTIMSDYIYNSEAGESTSYTKYTPVLCSPCHVWTQPLYEYMIRKWGKKITYSSSGKLVLREDATRTFPFEAYTADFFHFTDNSKFSYGGDWISVKNVSTPAWSYTDILESEDENGNINVEESIKEGQEAKDNVYIDYYPGVNIFKYNDYYEYQDKLYKTYDSQNIVPRWLVKCYDGLDYAAFLSLCSETSNFQQKTTLFFDHD